VYWPWTIVPISDTVLSNDVYIYVYRTLKMQYSILLYFKLNLKLKNKSKANKASTCIGIRFLTVSNPPHGEKKRTFMRQNTKLTT